MLLQTITTTCAVGIIAATMKLSPFGLGPASNAPASNPSETIARGKTVFDIACSPCHGLDGAGDGPLSANMRTRPRDLTKGVYKSRSTASGQLPTDEDLDRSIMTGVHFSTMPAFRMSPTDCDAVIQYLKTLSPRFSDSTEYPLEVLTFGQMILPSTQSIERGRAVYVKMQCESCHGAAGKGDGVSAEIQHDDFGSFVHTTDLTNVSDFKFAQSAQDVYRIFSTGLNGVAMPSYASTLPDTDRWHLANYVWNLHGIEH
ncbi:MAG: c-type cytochrome [Bacteroidota bacterium]|nr:c-type cytochrome [Bacteroidota bacterium]MDP4234185.1 c-type cytochrome [Bacteroidota bacterium]MDP4243749.1 c-type cytochrome [Bacteroidota bacterium]MDP4287886.1 c-type cytochrome [Bacteroidota bacterium]